VEAGEQAAVAYGEGGGGFAGGGVDHFAVVEFEGEVQGYLRALGCALVVGRVVGLVYAWGALHWGSPSRRASPASGQGLAVQVAGALLVVVSATSPFGSLRV